MTIVKFNVKTARVNAGFSQREIAEKLGMSLNSYLRYERRELVFRVDKAWEFSQYTKIPFDQIIFFTKNYTSSVEKEKRK